MPVEDPLSPRGGEVRPPWIGLVSLPVGLESGESGDNALSSLSCSSGTSWVCYSAGGGRRRVLRGLRGWCIHIT